MLSAMSARQFADWAAFYEQEPFGDFRADLRAGIVAATVANVHRGSKTPPFTPQDFMPYVEKPPIAEIEIESKIEIFMSGYGR